ncbi:hypothetical protein B0J13DRAFT_557053 [Dactylonectria estremocensis]|uniref:Uncharacterized protein n=1 Tax=Dactylonectria estremocensis TaxID=1079267 RepID=A0A9P9ER30_9HYPO|nr:hypothetical protein B0J13DRAFT_557053 [Dactylonectria estremocensis]
MPTMRVTLIIAYLATLGTGLRMDVYSDKNCKDKTGSYNCGPIWKKCHQLSHSVRSYQIVEESDTCGSHLWDTLVLYTSKTQCNPRTLNGGAGRAGCEKHGCMPTYNEDATEKYSTTCGLGPEARQPCCTEKLRPGYHGESGYVMDRWD